MSVPDTTVVGLAEQLDHPRAVVRMDKVWSGEALIEFACSAPPPASAPHLLPQESTRQWLQQTPLKCFAEEVQSTLS